MPIVVNIYSLEDVKQENQIVSLSEGTHNIGRGELLKITDKRVSRKHAIIEITEDKIILTSVHVNPCFVRAAIANANTILIKENEKAELHNGDLFGLLPADCWFKVCKVDTTKKRQLSDESETADSQWKRPKQTENNNVNNKSAMMNKENGEVTDDNTFMGSTTTVNNDHQLSTQTCLNEGQLPSTVIDNANQEIADTMVKKEDTSREETAASEEEAENATREVKQEVKMEPNDNSMSEVKTEVDAQNGLLQTPTQPNNNQIFNTNGLANAPPTTTQVNQSIRERCWYGQNCYRKNPNHRASFSHPGDQDYGNDASTLPECPFGSGCYRRHPEHRRQYKHTAGPANVPSSNATNQQASRRHRHAKKAQANDDEDDYDYDDPFINDGSSSDYEPSDDSIDISTDEEDSQENAQALSPHRKRMLREAKKIIDN